MANITPLVLKIEHQRVSTRYELVRGLVVRINEIEVQEIDTDEWKVAGRKVEETYKTQAELIAELNAQKNDIDVQMQAEIDKVTSAPTTG